MAQNPASSQRPTQDEVNNFVNVITEQEVIDFLTPRTRSYQCPVCLTQKWGVFLRPDMRFGLLGEHLNGNVIVPPPLLPTVMAICETCHFMRLHALEAIAADILKERRDSKPAQAK